MFIQKFALITLLLSTLNNLCSGQINDTVFSYVGGNFHIDEKEHNGYRAIITTGPLYGFAREGRIVIEPKYDFAYEFVEGLAAVKLNGKYGFINQRGTMIITLTYENASNFREGLAVVELNNKVGVINRDGQMIVPFDYDHIASFKQGLARVIKDNKIGFVNKEGNIIIPAVYDEAGYGNEALISVKRNDKAGFIDYQGRVIIPLVYEDTRDFANGLGWVTLNGKQGFVDKTGKIVIKPNMAHLWDYSSNGLAVFTNTKGKSFYGVINKKGKVIIEPKYNMMGNYQRDYALFELSLDSGENYINGLVDAQGNEYFNFISPSGVFNEGEFHPGIIKIYEDKNLTIIKEIVYDNQPVEILEKAIVLREGKRNKNVVKINYHKQSVGWVLEEDVVVNGKPIIIEHDSNDY